MKKVRDYQVTFRDRNGIYNQVIVTGVCLGDVQKLVQNWTDEAPDITRDYYGTKPGQPHLYTQAAMEILDENGVEIQ